MNNNTYKTLVLGTILVTSFLGCDEEMAPPSFDLTTPKEKLLIKDWTYDYILMGTDTIKSLTDKGEPRTVGLAIDQSYLRYDEEHSYEFRWEDKGPFDQREYGVEDNYQPNYGYWHLSENEDTLIHNKLQSYEKQYEILELTDQRFRRKLIGGRTSFLTNADREVIDTITGQWIEVFVTRTLPN